MLFVIFISVEIYLINKTMIEQNLISDRKISKSLTKLQTISSDKKFRVKSLRMKTNTSEI